MGCTLLQRLHHQCGGSAHIPNTCGYRAQAGKDGTIYIIPSVNGCNNLITLSVGDAVIRFDTKAPPKFLTAVITEATNGDGYSPLVSFNRPRLNATYTSAKLTDVTFTDANKKTSTVKLMEVKGYQEIPIQQRATFKAMSAVQHNISLNNRILW